MRGYLDLEPAFRRKPEAKMRAVISEHWQQPLVEREALKSQTMSSLCPGAFDGFRAYVPLPEQPPQMRTIDPGNRLEGARKIDAETARRKGQERHQRVLSVVISEGGPGADAYGSETVKVVVPGFRPGAEEYFLSGA